MSFASQSETLQSHSATPVTPAAGLQIHIQPSVYLSHSTLKLASKDANPVALHWQAVPVDRQFQIKAMNLAVLQGRGEAEEALQRERAAHATTRHGFEDEVESLLQTNKLLGDEIRKAGATSAADDNARPSADGQVGKSWIITSSGCFVCGWLIDRKGCGVC